ncbi:MAG TPA: hypothetical protein VGB68_04530 [Pyrinomonadaceae bacterium]|jgi:hypothetical protein
MRELGLGETISQKGFRRRQFQQESTESQRNFDVWALTKIL